MKHKNASIRYNTLDECFRSQVKRYSITDLLRRCNEKLEESGVDSIKKRQLYKDIAYMESDQGWSINLRRIRDGKMVYFRYEDTNFSISSASELNNDQKKNVKEMLLTLSTMKGIPQLDLIDIERVCAQLKIGLEDKEIREAIYLRDTDDDYMQFGGGKHLEKLFGYASSKISIKIEFLRKDDTPTSIVMSPYFLKEYNSRWYVIGQTKEHEVLTNVALDRITKITESNSGFSQKPNFYNPEYFDDFIGVTKVKNTSPQKVVLQIDKSIWYILKSRPIHFSQSNKPKELEGYYIVSLTVIPNRELENKLMYWGENITVLEPPELRDKMSAKVAKMKDNYISAQ